jgi:hypothetical protein
MCFRKLQNWNRGAILNEFTRFVADSVVSRDETLFLDKFEGEVIIPNGKLPKWLWKGQKYVRHPSIRIRLPALSAMPSPSAVVSSGLSSSIPLSSSNPNLSVMKEKETKQQKLKSKVLQSKTKNKLPDLSEEIEFAKSFTWNYKTEQRFKHEYFDVLFLSEKKDKDQGSKLSKVIQYAKSCKGNLIIEIEKKKTLIFLLFSNIIL